MKLHRPLLLLALLTTILLTSACGTSLSQTSPTVKLDRAMRAFHHSLVWQRYDEASVYVAPRLRLAFLKHYEDQQSELQFLEYELHRVEISDNELHAEVAVQLSWYRLPSTSIQTTLLQETWAYLEAEQRWELVKQEAEHDGPEIRK